MAPPLSVIRLPGFQSFAIAILVCVFGLLAGCNTPDKANIELRKTIDTLHAEADRLNAQHVGDLATIAALQNTSGIKPAVSHDRIEQLFTVHGLKLGRLTGPDDWNAEHPGVTGIKVSAVPTDEQGDQIKAAGSFVVEAFDLARPEKPLIGQWKFDVKHARERWYGPLLYSYELKCPWQERPTHEELTIKVTFTDELTGRSFTAQKVVKVTPFTPTTAPATRPA